MTTTTYRKYDNKRWIPFIISEFMCGIADQTIFLLSPMSTLSTTHVLLLGSFGHVGWVWNKIREEDPSKRVFTMCLPFSRSRRHVCGVSRSSSASSGTGTPPPPLCRDIILLCCELLLQQHSSQSSLSLERPPPCSSSSCGPLFLLTTPRTIYFDYIIRWLLPGLHIPVHV